MIPSSTSESYKFKLRENDMSEMMHAKVTQERNYASDYNLPQPLGEFFQESSSSSEQPPQWTPWHRQACLLASSQFQHCEEQHQHDDAPRRTLLTAMPRFLQRQQEHS